MDKHFFKFENDICIKNILEILDISKTVFLDNNKNLNLNILKSKIIDFVSYENLELNKLSYFSNKKKKNENVILGICIVEKNNFDLLNINLIKIPYENPRLGFSKVLNFYFNNYHLKNKNYYIHPSSIVDDSAIIGNNVNIGPFTIIEAGVVIGDNVFISERVTVSKNCKIGNQSFLGSGVFIQCAYVGSNVVISPNTIIGKAGFGFIPNKSKTLIIK